MSATFYNLVLYFIETLITPTSIAGIRGWKMASVDIGLHPYNYCRKAMPCNCEARTTNRSTTSGK
jgi:hypothetical protein